MKQRKLYILLIGMISLTVMASTPPPEQKLKTEPVQIEMIQEQILTVEPMSNESTIAPVTNVTKQIQAFKTNYETVTFTFSNYPKDVGWIHTTSYESKLSTPIIRHFKLHNTHFLHRHCIPHS